MTRAWAVVEAWLTESKHSLRGLAITRIVLGFVVWSQLVMNWPDRHYTWGDGARWTDPIGASARWPAIFGAVVQLRGGWFDLAYVLAIGFGVALMLGFATRASTVLTLLLWMSIYVTNPFVGSGGDAVLRMVLLYLCFTDAGRYWSLDARRAARRGAVRPVTPPWWSNAVHNVAVVLIVHQVVMVYVGSAFWKLKGPTWIDGTAVYYPLQTDAYSPWGDVIEPLSGWGPMVHLASWSAIAIQLFVPVLLLYRPTRLVALISLTGMHLGIGVLMGIMYFSLVMIAVDMILISDGSWQRWERRAAGWTRRRLRHARGASHHRTKVG